MQGSSGRVAGEYALPLAWVLWVGCFVLWLCVCHWIHVVVAKASIAKSDTHRGGGKSEGKYELRIDFAK